MIFKNLFKPKYQHADPLVRIESIEHLIPDDAKHKSQLHELAFNDADHRVSIAALNKLNSFDLWCKMAQTGKNERVRKKAQQQVESLLFDQQHQHISEQEQRTFIQECSNNKLLEKWLKIAVQQKTDLPLILQVLERLDKPQLSRQMLMQSDYSELQLALLKECDDEATLNKISKKSRNTNVKQMASDKLADLQQRRAIPVEVEQQGKMLLSLLLALKDNKDYVQLEQKKSELSMSFQQLSLLFGSLSKEKSEEFNTKYADIEKKLETRLQTLKPQWQSKQQAQQADTAWQTVSAAAEADLTTADELLSNEAGVDESVLHAAEQTLQQTRQRLLELSNEHSLSENAAKSRENLLNKVESAVLALQKQPQYMAAQQQGQVFLDSFSELGLPTDLNQIQAAKSYLQDLKKQWRSLTHEFTHNWPSSQQQQWQAQHQAWQKAIKELEQTQRDRQHECRGKLRAINGMLEQGRYKNAMRLYEKVSRDFNSLPEDAQATLQRGFNKVKEAIENLKDWQAYVALPKKPGLLDEAEALVKQPQQIEQQAKEVKRLRAEWNSLGHSGTEGDDALNAAFEAALEQAFAPCREHFAQVEAEREKHYKQKLALIEEVKSLGQGDKQPAASLVKQLRQLQQRWRQIGHVDYRKVQSLKDGFNGALAPIKQAVSEFEQTNAEAKAKLVEKAQALATSEDLNQAIERAKLLQQRWKQIEHAGKKAEDKLWSAFRTANDALFNRRHAEQKAQKAELNEQIDTAKQSIEQWQSQLEQADSKSGLTEVLGKERELQQQVKALPARPQKALLAKLDKSAQHGKDKLHTYESQQQQQAYQQLFSCLADWRTDHLPDVSSLNRAWQQAFANPAPEEHKRHHLTVQLEILSSQPTPDEDVELRKQMQLNLLSDKLRSGVTLSKSDLLLEWIKQGALDEKDLTLLKRVRACF